jgi:hypothetical protein
MSQSLHPNIAPMPGQGFGNIIFIDVLVKCFHQVIAFISSLKKYFIVRRAFWLKKRKIIEIQSKMIMSVLIPCFFFSMVYHTSCKIV